MKTLILGGTREGRELAQELVERGHDVVTSLAGRITKQAPVAGQVRIGGFGGPTGLAQWLLATGIEKVVDATHPFAEQITQNAAEACHSVGVPLLRVSRPSWREHPLADTWTWVDSHAQAAIEAAKYQRVLLTVGRQSVAPYRGLTHALARMVELPDDPLPKEWIALLDRGPYSVAQEVELLKEHGIEALVTKDSGGKLTSAKLDAAREVGTRVIIIRRAPLPPGVPQVRTPAEAVDWVLGEPTDRVE